MASFQISITPARRAAVRFVTAVRRALQKIYVDEKKKRGLKQTDIARAIGVHRSVINRQLQGIEDMTLSRVAELACAMGRRAVLDFPEATNQVGSNIGPAQTQLLNSSSTTGATTLPPAPATPMVVMKNSGSKFSRKVVA